MKFKQNTPFFMTINKFLRRFPASLLLIALICYLSFFKPPQTSLNKIVGIDKLIHMSMYAALSSLLWVEYFIGHRIGKPIKWGWIGCFALPLFMGGVIEIAQPMFSEFRGSEWLDFVANATGVTLAALFARFIIFRFWMPKA